jgi:hypothetical protein
MKIGDKVRVIGTPENLPDNEIATKQIFELCVGRIFPIEDVKRVEGLDHDVIELLVGEVVDEPDYMHSIYLEPEFLEIVRDED